MKNIFLLLIFSLLVCNSGIGQSTLEKAEKSLSKKKEKNNSRGDSRSYTYSDSSDSENNFIADTFGVLFLDIFLAATYGIIIETPFEQEYTGSQASLTKYPYHSGAKGNFSYEHGDDTTIFKTTIADRYIVENGKIYGNQLMAEFWFAKRISLKANYLQLWEDNIHFENNSLAMYQGLAKYHRIRTERFNAWWGLGATYVDGEVDETGFTYGLGAELFLVKPISIEADFMQTFINNETVNQFSTLMNYHIKRYKVSGGYEHLKLGIEDFSMFSIGVGVSF